jgi:hypothetical protein
MKITFTHQELKYLEAYIRLMSDLLLSKRIDDKLARIVVKMRHKFSPNALKTFLVKKERDTLASFLNYRQSQLIKENSVSEELDVLQSLIEKVETK